MGMTYLTVHLAIHAESSSAYESHTSTFQCLEVPTDYKMGLFLNHWKKVWLDSGHWTLFMALPVTQKGPGKYGVQVVWVKVYCSN